MEEDQSIGEGEEEREREREGEGERERVGREWESEKELDNIPACRCLPAQAHRETCAAPSSTTSAAGAFVFVVPLVLSLGRAQALSSFHFSPRPWTGPPPRQGGPGPSWYGLLLVFPAGGLGVIKHSSTARNVETPGELPVEKTARLRQCWAR